MNVFKKCNDPNLAKATEEQIGLLLQRDLEMTLKAEFVGSSLSHTLYRTILLGKIIKFLSIF